MVNTFSTKSIKKANGNVGSCFSLAKYLDKEIKGEWFNSSQNIFDTKYIISQIDKNGKGQLKKTDWKFVEIEYNPSFKETQQMIKIATGRTDVIEWKQLSPAEQQATKSVFMEFVQNAQTEQAKNYNRENISTGADLLWFGKIETKRKYKGFDKDVKNGIAKSGQLKKGLNLHCHIIQSRRCINKKVKLSPLSSQKKQSSKNPIQQGFDRNKFKGTLENLFDNQFNYSRNQTETFEYCNNRAKEKAQAELQSRLKEYNIELPNNTQKLKTRQKTHENRTSTFVYNPIANYLIKQEKSIPIFEKQPISELESDIVYGVENNLEITEQVSVKEEKAPEPIEPPKKKPEPKPEPPKKPLTRQEKIKLIVHNWTKYPFKKTFDFMLKNGITERDLSSELFNVGSLGKFRGELNRYLRENNLSKGKGRGI